MNVILQYGFPLVEQFLAGAHAMDTHFFETPLRQNLPVLMGLLGVWNSSFLGHSARAILPCKMWSQVQSVCQKILLYLFFFAPKTLRLLRNTSLEYYQPIVLFTHSAHSILVMSSSVRAFVICSLDVRLSLLTLLPLHDLFFTIHHIHPAPPCRCPSTCEICCSHPASWYGK